MEKNLLQKTLEKLDSLAASESGNLSLEELGVLQLFLRTRRLRGDSLGAEEIRLFDRAEAALSAWAELPSTEALWGGDPAEGLQKQPVLFRAFGKLSQNQFAKLTEAESVFLRAVDEALDRSSCLDEEAKRLQAGLKAGIALLDGKALAQEPAPPEDMSASQIRNQVESQTLFTDKRRKKVGSLDGIKMDLTVTTYELQGETELSGDVPDDVLLVVRDGGITVNGFVEGNILAAEDITVNGNTSSGWLVSSKGDVSAVKALRDANLIAKQGRVRVQSVEFSGCLYAQEGVSVEGNVQGGKLIGSEIEVEGEVRDAELHSVGPVQAESLGEGTVVCLRDSVSSEDYGQPLDSSALSLHRGMAKFVHEAKSLNQFVTHARGDIQAAQRTALYFLLGGVENMQDVRALRGLQCQASFAQELVEVAQELLSIPPAAPGDSQAAEESALLARECLDAVNHVESELKTLSNNFDLAHKGALVRACRDLRAACELMGKGPLSAEAAGRIAAELEEKCAKWSELRAQLGAQVDAQVSNLRLDREVVRSIETNPEKTEAMLSTVLEQAEKNPNLPQHKRANSYAMRLINTTVERNQKNIKGWARGMRKAREKLADVRAVLTKSGSFLFGRSEEEGASVQAGQYGEGAAIAANPDRNSNPLDTAKDLLRFEEVAEGPLAFRLRDGQIEEYEPPAEDNASDDA